MKSRKLFVLSFGLITAAIAEAGEAAGKSVDEEFKKADANGDAKVTAAEHATCATDMFSQMDANHDGKVTVAELSAMHQKMSDHDAGKDEMSAAEMIKMVDKDGDGVLTAEEHTEGARTMFAKMDTNQDGALTKSEMAEGHARLMKKHHGSDS